MANLPVAFAEILVGAVVLDAAIKGDSIANVIKGQATQHPITGLGSGSGSSTGTSSSAASGVNSLAPGTYTNPVPGATTGRLDQGVDYALGPAGFVAPGNSQIVYVASGSGLQGWGNEYVAGQLLDGPLKGAIWYIAEAGSVASGIVKGATVSAGQQITPQGSSTGGAIEAGWADPSNPGNPLARSLTGYSGDQSLGALTAGYSFSNFVHALGGPFGHFSNVAASLMSAVESEFSTKTVTGVPYTGS